MIPTTSSLEGRIADLERQVTALLSGSILENASLALGDGTVVTTTEMAEAPAAATTALAVASGKTTTYVGDTAPGPPPGGFQVNDEWLVTGTSGNLLNYWDGTVWVPSAWRGSALAADAIDGKVITGAVYRTSDPAVQVQRVELTSTDGLRGYGSGGVVNTSIDPATGLLTASGATIAGLLRTAPSGPRIELEQAASVGSGTQTSGRLRFFAGQTGELAWQTAGVEYEAYKNPDGTVYGSELSVRGGQRSSTGGGPGGGQITLSEQEKADSSGYESVISLNALRLFSNAEEFLLYDGDLIVGDAAGIGGNIFAAGLVNTSGGYGSGGVNVGTGVAATGTISTDGNITAAGSVGVGSTTPSAGHAIRRDWVEARVEGGSASFTVPAINTVYSQTITFANPKVTTPAVVATVVSATPQNYAVSVGGLTNTSFTLYLRSSAATGTTGVRWVAVSL